MNILLTVLVKSILPVTASLAAIVVVFYVLLLIRISQLLKRSSIARNILKGTVRNYITTLLIFFSLFSFSRDVIIPLLLEATVDCIKTQSWIKLFFVLHAFHWIIDPIIYFFYYKASRQTFRKLLRNTNQGCQQLRTQIDILLIVYCPCDCPISYQKRDTAIQPEGNIFYIVPPVISNNANRRTMQAE